jgi:hypothetical protein
MRTNLGHPLGRPADSQHTNPTSQAATMSEQSAARSHGPARRRIRLPAMRRAVSLIGALTAALVIGLAGTGAAQAASVGPNVTLQLTTAECYPTGQVRIHYGFYPAYGYQYYVSVRLRFYIYSTGLWSSPSPWSPAQAVTPGQKLNYPFDYIPHGTYGLLTEWKQWQGNGWSPSIYDWVDQVFNYRPDWSVQSSSESICTV